MGIEARRQPRRAVDGRIDVVDCIRDETIGLVGNLSASGMLLIANRSLRDDALFQFRFALPDGRREPIETGAHVIWQAEAGAPGQSWVGLRFIGLPPDAARRLRDWASQPGVGGKA